MGKEFGHAYPFGFERRWITLNRCRVLSVILLVTWSGCSHSEEDDRSDGPPRVPVIGTVRLDGQPLSGAVVVFLPVDELGKVAQSDTDEDGKYALRFAGFPGGTTPGKYRVGISYLISRKGEPIGVSGRGSLPPNPEVAHAKELVAPRYSDLGRTELTAVVSPEGGTFDFDLKGPLLPAPTAESEGESTSASTERDLPPPPSTLTPESSTTPEG